MTPFSGITVKESINCHWSCFPTLNIHQIKKIKAECLHEKILHRWYILYIYTLRQDRNGSYWPSFKTTCQFPISPRTPQNPILFDGDAIAALSSAASPIPIDFYNADCSHNYLTLNESEIQVNMVWMLFETPSNYSAWETPSTLKLRTRDISPKMPYFKLAKGNWMWIKRFGLASGPVSYSWVWSFSKNCPLIVSQSEPQTCSSAARSSWWPTADHSQPRPRSCAFGRDAICHRRQVWSFQASRGSGLFNQRVTGMHLKKLRVSGQSSRRSKSHGCIRTRSSSNDGSLVK